MGEKKQKPYTQTARPLTSTEGGSQTNLKSAPRQKGLFLLGREKGTFLLFFGKENSVRKAGEENGL